MAETIELALETLRDGRPILVCMEDGDSVAGYLALAGGEARSRSIHFLTRHSSGLISAALEPRRLHDLGIPFVTTPNGGGSSGAGVTGCGVSVGLKGAAGESSRDRARTIRALADPTVRRGVLVMPGSVFPFGIHDHGVLGRKSAFEASVDLARLAGLAPVTAMARLLHEDGQLPDHEQIRRFARRHDMPLVRVDEVRTHRSERRLRGGVQSRMPTRFGEFTASVYEDTVTGFHHVALYCGDVADGEPVLCRAHSECLTGEVLTSLRCDCGPQLEAALEHIAREGRGVLLYLRQEGRGIGLYNKIRSYALQDQGLDTVEANERLGFDADARDYGIAAEILRELGIRTIRLLTNNPRKIAGMETLGIRVAERVPLIIQPNTENRRYLEVKRTKLGHLLEDGPSTLSGPSEHVSRPRDRSAHNLRPSVGHKGGD
jgi:3,4-dihydroxy 2-butanone 4-phosphate synthase/GTP cyclohydrolase II